MKQIKRKSHLLFRRRKMTFLYGEINEKRTGAQNAKLLFYVDFAVPDDIQDIESFLTKLHASEFTSDSDSGKEELSVILHTGMDGAEEITIRFLRKDGETCLAEMNGSPLALVSRSEVIELKEAVNRLVLS